MSMRPAPTACLFAALLAGCAFDPSGPAGSDPSDPDAPTDPAIDAPEPPGDGPRPDAPPGDVDGPPSAVRFRKPITIAAGTIDATLADFPLYVELTDADLAARARADGADLHFVAADGSTALDHEVQAWDDATGHLEAWVRIPSLADDASTTIYLRYGAFASAPPEDPAGVWQDGFVAVWHLDGAPGGGQGDIAEARGVVDATSSGGMNANSRVDGVLGGALRFDGNNDQLAFTNPLTGASAHTISAWVDQGDVDHHSALVVLGNGACAQARWLHTRYIGGPVAAGFYCDDWATTGVDVQDDGWTLVHWVYASDGQSRLYRDGVLVAGPHQHLGTQSTAGTAGYIGNAPAAFGNPMGLLGAVDEVRIADVARTPEWIAAEHANQAAPTSFYAVGAEQPLP